MLRVFGVGRAATADVSTSLRSAQHDNASFSGSGCFAGKNRKLTHFPCVRSERDERVRRAALFVVPGGGALFEEGGGGFPGDALDGCCSLSPLYLLLFVVILRSAATKDLQLLFRS